MPLRLSRQETRLLDIRRRQLSIEDEDELFYRNLHVAVDGSIIQEGDDVYVLDAPFQYRVTRIDYFHGMRHGVPTAQLWNEDECLALNMVQLGDWGIAVHCIAVLQRKWRNRQWRLCVQPELIRLAKHMLKQVSRV